MDRPAGTRRLRRFIHEDRKRYYVVSSEGSSEYYIVRVYRRQPGPGASTLLGLVEDRDGRRRPFHDFEGLVEVLTEVLEDRGMRSVEGDATQDPDRV